MADIAIVTNDWTQVHDPAHHRRRCPVRRAVRM
jgi:hypothetical protein